TNDAYRPAASRFYAGWRFALHNLVLMVAVTYLLLLLFRRTSRVSPDYVTLIHHQQLMVGTVVVWGVSWLAHLFLWCARRGRAAAGQPGEKPHVLPVNGVSDLTHGTVERLERLADAYFVHGAEQFQELQFGLGLEADEPGRDVALHRPGFQVVLGVQGDFLA